MHMFKKMSSVARTVIITMAVLNCLQMTIQDLLQNSKACQEQPNKADQKD